MKTDAKKDALVTKSDLPTRLQNRPEGQGKEGFENVEPNDMIMPRLALCQEASDEKKKQNAKYIPGLEPGQFFNTLTKENYGTEILMLPVHHYKTRIFWTGKTPGSGIRCRSFDFRHGQGDPGGDCMKCEYSQWLEKWKDKDNIKGHPPCNSFWNFPVLVVDKNGKADPSTMVVCSFKSLGIDLAAKPLITLGNMRKGAPSIYDCVYKLYSVLKSRDSGDSFQPIIVNPENGMQWATDEAAYNGKMCHDIVSEAQKIGRFKFEGEEMPEPGSDG